MCFHGKITAVGAGLKPAPTDTEKTHGLPEIICGLKTFSARRINQIRNTPGAKKLWQRNYYEHIVRNENELNRIRQYIVDNPAKWEYDHENLSVGGSGPCACPDGPCAYPDMGQPQGVAPTGLSLPDVVHRFKPAWPDPKRPGHPRI